MNPECAKKVIKILLCADGGCIYCASELIKLFVEEFSCPLKYNLTNKNGF